jgi:hypothetical protein
MGNPRGARHDRELAARERKWSAERIEFAEHSIVINSRTVSVTSPSSDSANAASSIPPGGPTAG